MVLTTRNSTAGAPGSDVDPHESPWITLIYLVFAYIPLLFVPGPVGRLLLVTLLATALFVPLHFGFYRRQDERSPLPWVLAVAAIGYGLIPFNSGGNTFIIYALAMLAVSLNLRQAIGLGIGLLLLMTGEFLLLIPQVRVALAIGFVTAVIGAMVMTGILISRARARQHAELRLTQDEVRRLAGMAERERIGRDLHDLLGHTLSVVALKSELAGKLIDRDPGAARVQIREVETVAREALAQVREAVAGIRAAGLEAELASARLTLLVADVKLDQHLVPFAIDAKLEQALALAVREAVTNILRHAAAKRVEIELVEDRDTLRLSIADDGRGGIERHGNGLNGMRERIEAVGGSIEIESARGAGTRLLLRVPRHDAEGADA